MIDALFKPKYKISNIGFSGGTQSFVRFGCFTIFNKKFYLLGYSINRGLPEVPSAVAEREGFNHYRDLQSGCTTFSLPRFNKNIRVSDNSILGILFVIYFYMTRRI